jgi:hypothetical protein
MKLNPSDLFQVPSPHWSVGIMTDLGNGYYQGNYFPEKKDQYDISIQLAESGGLYGLYYDNVWFLNAPSVARVDPTINFQVRALLWVVCICTWHAWHCIFVVF